jgi:hypothetical protein
MNESKTGAEPIAATGNKIDRETAEAEFIRYCEMNEFLHDESEMEDEEKESFSEIKNRFIRACMSGRVEVGGSSLKYTLSKFKEGSIKKNWFYKRIQKHKRRAAAHFRNFRLLRYFRNGKT